MKILEKIENRNSRRERKVAIGVEDLAELADLFLKLDTEEMDMLRSCVTERTGQIMIGFTNLLGQKAIEQNDRRWIKRALAIHTIENIQTDDRENLLRLFSLAPALNSLTMDWESAWREVDIAITQRVQKHLVEKTI